MSAPFSNDCILSQSTWCSKKPTDSNYVTSLPSDIGQLSHLEMLDLSELECKLKTYGMPFVTLSYGIFLTKEISKYACIKPTGSNLVISLPSEIGQLSHLEMLVLSELECKLKTYGISFVTLIFFSQNKYLYHSTDFNSLTSLPSEIGWMWNLSTIDLGELVLKQNALRAPLFNNFSSQIDLCTPAWC